MKSFGIATKAAIIKDDRLLIIYKTVKEAARDPDPEFRRDFPGGRLEFGEDPEASLVREIAEEVGLAARVISPVYVWHYIKNDFQLVGITYYCRWIKGEVILSEEHEEFEWLTLQEISDRGWQELEEYLAIFRFHNHIVDLTLC